MGGPAFEVVTGRIAETTGYRPPREGGAWRCPAHEDHNPSLSVSNGDGKVLLNCHGPCTVDDVLAALDLKAADLFDDPKRPTPPKERPRVVATYTYTDEAGQPLFLVRRWQPGFNGERKSFTQHRPDGTKGIAGVRRVPYRLPAVLDAAARGVPVFVVEGEKDVHAVEAAGAVATCNPAGSSQWRAEFADYLAGAAQVVIVRDKDTAGAKWAADVEASVAGKVDECVIVEALTGKDASEHLGAGHTLEELQVVEQSGGDTARTGSGDLAVGDPDRYTDAANALRLAAAHGHELRHVPAWSTWLVWDGRRWKPDTKGAVVERAKAVAAERWDEVQWLTGDERKAAARWAGQSEAAGHIDAMIRLARSHPGIPVDPDELNRGRWHLNVANGTIDLRTSALHPHDPRHLVTRLADIEYQPEAPAPRWHAFLEQILPDPDVREFLARWCGYCLTGDVSEHKTVFAIGPGSNGKGTLFGTLQRLLGDYAAEAAPDMLLRRHDEPHPTGLADLHGRRLVLAAETGEGRRLDEALVKRLTGGDRIKARKLYQDFFEFDPTHKFVVATNHRPEVEGTDHGIWRRLRLVPFTVTIPDHERDLHLADKLLEEGPGILAWAVAGCRRWLAAGLTEPLAVTVATDDYRADMDPLGDFLGECCYIAPGLSARAGDLHAAHVRWAEAAGHRTINATKFGRALADRGLAKRKSNGIWWDGIGLRADDHTEQLERLEGGSAK